jgi:hypothetical protein
MLCFFTRILSTQSLPLREGTFSCVASDIYLQIFFITMFISANAKVEFDNHMNMNENLERTIISIQLVLNREKYRGHRTLRGSSSQRICSPLPPNAAILRGFCGNIRLAKIRMAQLLLNT